MKAYRRRKAIGSRKRPAPSIRVESLAKLPAEFGCTSMVEFIRHFRKAMGSARPRKVHKTKKAGSTLIMRNRIEHSITLGKSAMVIALELGISMRVVDRVMNNLERLRRKPKSMRNLRGRARSKQPELVDLPFLFGFDSPDSFIRAAQTAALQRPDSTWDQKGRRRETKIR